jgi:hypothetical protein
MVIRLSISAGPKMTKVRISPKDIIPDAIYWKRKREFTSLST